MTGVETRPKAVVLGAAAAAWRRLFRDQPIIPLLGLLLTLVVLMQLVQPGTVNPIWVGTTIKFAIPLAILAACQTLTMLTGGIDLSVALVASMGAFIMATQAPTQGPVVAICSLSARAGWPGSRTASAWACSGCTP